MQNDLARGACPAEDVCCVVFDEAHKALGNHAYCQVSTGLIPGDCQLTLPFIFPHNRKRILTCN